MKKDGEQQKVITTDDKKEVDGEQQKVITTDDKKGVDNELDETTLETFFIFCYGNIKYNKIKSLFKDNTYKDINDSPTPESIPELIPAS